MVMVAKQKNVLDYLLLTLETIHGTGLSIRYYIKYYRHQVVVLYTLCEPQFIRVYQSQYLPEVERITCLSTEWLCCLSLHSRSPYQQLHDNKECLWCVICTVFSTSCEITILIGSVLSDQHFSLKNPLHRTKTYKAHEIVCYFNFTSTEIFTGLARLQSRRKDRW